MANDDRDRQDRGVWQAQGAGGVGNIPAGGSYGGAGQHGGSDPISSYGAMHGGTGAAHASSRQHSGEQTVGGYGGMMGGVGGLRGDPRYGAGDFGHGGHGLYGGNYSEGDFGRGQMSGFGGQHTSPGTDRARHYEQFGNAHRRDQDYHALRERYLQQFDRDYDEFRRHRQERMTDEFEGWRRKRQHQANLPGAQDLTGQTTAGTSKPIPNPTGPEASTASLSATTGATGHHERIDPNRDKE